MSTRNLNHDALEKLDSDITKDEIGTGDLTGGELPRDLFDEFVERVQKEATLLDLIRTVEMPRKEMAIPKVGVGRQLLSEQTEGESPGAFEDAVSGAVELDASRKTVIPYELTQESVEDIVGGEEVADIILSHFEQQFAVDVQNLLINGDTDAASAFFSILDGYLEIARGADSESDRIGSPATDDDEVDSMPELDQAGAGIDTQLFNDAIQTLEERYRDPTSMVFMMSETQHQEYLNTLEDREDGLGPQILQGDDSVSPFGYDIQPVPDFPDDTILLTDPDNLVYGIHRDVEVDVIDESDEVLERDLFARYALRARWDAQIEDLQAGVLVENVAEP